MLQPAEIMALCPRCPKMSEIAARRRANLDRMDQLGDDTYPTEQIDIERRAAWDDDDARRLASTCIKVRENQNQSRTGNQTSFKISLHCTSSPEKY